MLKTRAPVIRRSSMTAASTTTSPKNPSASSMIVSAKTLQPTDQSRSGSSSEDQSNEAIKAIVTIQCTDSNKDALTTNNGLKRKRTAYDSDSSDRVPATKKTKTSSEPGVDDRDANNGLKRKRIACDRDSSDRVPATKKTKTSSKATTPPKKITRRKKPAVNPFRTDIRMGTSGTVAVGSGTVHVQKPKQSAPVKTPKTVPAVTAPEKPQPTADEKAEKEALEKLQAATSAASASKTEKASTVVDLGSARIPGLKRKLLTADRSVAKPRGAAAKFSAWKQKPEWRRDNDEIGDLIDDAYSSRKNVRPSKTTGMSAGAKKLLKVMKAGKRQEGRYINPANAYKRQREDEDAHIERVKKAAKRD
ncbi:hypothetical protein SLS60_000389 [Paraconiothyrium brasiliense]|uniref:Uncharacterized protein n=1 Tax=Paraconiothyrium brasiliense TaxID=300254 RepID=A0ABR3S665_9PLEO